MEINMNGKKLTSTTKLPRKTEVREMENTNKYFVITLKKNILT